MPDETFAEYEKMKTFLSFGDKEAAALQSLKPLFEQHGGGITDRFYEVLGQNEATASLIEGRVDALKATHGVWMMELFSGDYGRGYYGLCSSVVPFWRYHGRPYVLPVPGSHEPCALIPSS